MQSYNDIAKTNLVFGGVKVLQVIVNILKTKVVAILLGPVGVGVQTLLISTVTTLFQFTNFGISQSSVREISIAKDSTTKDGVLSSLNFMALAFGVTASILCFICAPILSKIIFGDEKATWMLHIVAVSLLFESIATSQIAILQGLRAIKKLAISSLLGSVAVLLVSIPIYYYWGEQSIPIVVTIGFLFPAIIYLITRKRHYTPHNKISEVWRHHAKSILTLGIALMAGNSIMALLNLGLNAFINQYGSSAAVGYFQAANTCTYSAITILTAILASDFFPRLASKIDKSSEAWEITNTQIELFVLVLGPIVSIMILFPEFCIRLLYSSEFLIVSMPVQIMGFSLLFRIPWHCFSYIILAKGDKKRFLFIDAIIGNGIFFASNILGFYIAGLKGVAISYVIVSLIVAIILYSTVHNNYGFTIKRSIMILGVTILIALSAIFVCTLYEKYFIMRLLSFIIFLILLLGSIVIFNRKTHLFNILRCYQKKKNN